MNTSQTTREEKRFAISFSFPGSEREIVREVASTIATIFSESRILYDEYHKPEFARPNLSNYIQELYRNQSELIVIFLCQDYKDRYWCNLEWRAISDLIGSIEEKRLMLFLEKDGLDLTELGVFRKDGYIIYKDMNSENISELILIRFRHEFPEILHQEVNSYFKGRIEGRKFHVPNDKSMIIPEHIPVDSKDKSADNIVYHRNNSFLHKLSKLRRSMIVELIILSAVQKVSTTGRTSYDQIEAALKRAGFDDIDRPSVVTKLARMKALGVLTWDATWRGNDIRITDAGREHYFKLRDRYLFKDDLAFLRQRIPELLE